MTDQTMHVSGAPRFSIGNVLNTSFTVLFGHVLKLAAIPALLSIPAGIIGFVVLFAMIRNSLVGLYQGEDPGPAFYIGFLILILLFLCWSSLASAIIVSGAFQALRTNTLALGAAFQRGFAVLIPVILTAIVIGIMFVLVMLACTVPLTVILAILTQGAVSLGITLGLFIFLVPGAILWTMLWLFTPAIVVEGKGVGSSLSRSRQLTKGHRWGVFAIILIIFVGNILISIINRFVIGAILGGIAQGIVSIVLTILLEAFTGIAITVTYYYLRAEKEGVGIDEIAKVFD